MQRSKETNKFNEIDESFKLGQTSKRKKLCTKSLIFQRVLKACNTGNLCKEVTRSTWKKYSQSVAWKDSQGFQNAETFTEYFENQYFLM